MNDLSDTKQWGLPHFLNARWLLLTQLFAPDIQYLIPTVSLLNDKFGDLCCFLFSQKTQCYTGTMKTVWEQQIHVAKFQLFSILFSHTALFTLVSSPRSCLKQLWLLHTSMRDLLQLSNAWSILQNKLARTSTGHRGQLSCDQGTAPFTYSSQQSKLRLLLLQTGI